MKTVFSSQDRKQIIFLPSSRAYPYIWIVLKSVLLFKSPSLHCSQTTDARVALASNFKGKMHSKQNLFAKCMTNVCTELWFLRGFLLRVSGFNCLKGWLTGFFLGLIVFMGCSLACVHACFF